MRAVSGGVPITPKGSGATSSLAVEEAEPPTAPVPAEPVAPEPVVAKAPAQVRPEVPEAVIAVEESVPPPAAAAAAQGGQSSSAGGDGLRSMNVYICPFLQGAEVNHISNHTHAALARRQSAPAFVLASPRHVHVADSLAFVLCVCVCVCMRHLACSRRWNRRFSA